MKIPLNKSHIGYLLVFLLLAFTVSACVVYPRHARVGVVVVAHAPPPPRVDHRPRPPSHAHIWIPGRWRWDNRWYWAPGHWMAPPRGAARWVEGHWVQKPRGWVWVEGHWVYR